MRIQTPILFLVVALVCVVARGSSVTVSFYALGSLSEMADGWTSSGVTLSSKTGDYKGGLMLQCYWTIQIGSKAFRTQIFRISNEIKFDPLPF